MHHIDRMENEARSFFVALLKRGKTRGRQIGIRAHEIGIEVNLLHGYASHLTLE